VPDLIFVDGPPFISTTGISRLKECQWALRHCPLVILHNARRNGEQHTLEELKKMGATVETIPTQKGMAVIRMAREGELLA
jgi:hypothetical protein